MPFINSLPPSAPARPKQKGRALLRFHAVVGFLFVMPFVVFLIFVMLYLLASCGAALTPRL